MENYDYVAIEDKIRRANLIDEEDFKKFRQELYGLSFFTNRRKIKIEDFEKVLENKEYKEKIITFVNENKISFKF